WLFDFKSVSTSAARYQNLSLNPSKLSGQCGRLKCCLNYELDTYIDALEDIPKVEKPLLTERGVAKLQKTDIFRKIMWFGYDDENTWFPIDAKRVKEIIKLNKAGKKPSSLQEDNVPVKEEVTINSDLERMDKKYSTSTKKKKRRKGKKRFPKNRNQDRNNKPS
ncbi:MAG: regulatory iron-sulfur-containing complex subunit RicT, partial [Fulvivirga sp.]